MHGIFCIEGNIGAGKTTFIHSLVSYFETQNIEVHILEEPVSIWQSIKDENNTDILSHFYKDQKKWAFSFQMMAYISRLTLLKNTIKNYPNSVIITERSVFSDKHVFAKLLYDNNMINEIDYQIYNKWFDCFLDDIPILGIIYLKCSPTIANERIIKRNREGETIPLEYLVKCNKYHDEWLNSIKTNVLTIDCNKTNTQINTNEWHILLEKFIRSIINS
tara:strand:+ start:918 stop:1574 length:657 start_codon:yes stop_codon:yes gene_type:complete